MTHPPQPLPSHSSPSRLIPVVECIHNTCSTPNRTYTLQYSRPGSPLSITLSEASVTTACALTTHEPETDEADIPLQQDAIIIKTIMRSAWLHNAISELDSTNPTVLKISASAVQEPFFSLSGSGGPFSKSVMEWVNYLWNPL